MIHQVLILRMPFSSRTFYTVNVNTIPCTLCALQSPSTVPCCFTLQTRHSTAASIIQKYRRTSNIHICRKRDARPQSTSQCMCHTFHVHRVKSTTNPHDKHNLMRNQLKTYTRPTETHGMGQQQRTACYCGAHRLLLFPSDSAKMP